MTGREPNKSGRLLPVTQQSSAWWDWTLRGQTPSRFLWGTTVHGWVTPITAFESSYCGCLITSLTSWPLSCFKNFHLSVHRHSWPLAAKPNFSPTLSLHIWDANLNHSMVPCLKFIKGTYGRPAFDIWPPAITSKVYHMWRWDNIHFLKPSFLSLFREILHHWLVAFLVGTWVVKSFSAIRLTGQATKAVKLSLHIFNQRCLISLWQRCCEQCWKVLIMHWPLKTLVTREG